MSPKAIADGVVDHDAARELPCNTGVRLLGGTSSALGRVTADKQVQLVRGDREAFGLHGRSADKLKHDPAVVAAYLGGSH